jgi:hypothetical protein
MILSRDRQFGIVGAAAAGAVGFAFALHPLPMLGAVVAICSVIYALVFKRCLSRLFLAGLGILLLGYAFLGRGFAYLGVPPIFVGEITLAFGILAATLSGGLAGVFRSRLAWLLVAFSIWGAFRTFPFVPTYGAEALRDAAMWGYGAFALIVAACLRQEGRSEHVVQVFGRCLPYFVIWVPVAWGIARATDGVIPTVPGSNVKLLVFSPGMMAVHLGGAASFLLLGLRDERARRPARALLAKWALWAAWALGLLIAASVSRGALVAALTSIMIVVLFRPIASARKVAAACLLAGAMAAVAPVLLVGEMARHDRTFEDSRVISPNQVAANLTSLFSGQGGDLEGTRRWRILWWRSIIDYTVFGDYFWTGKGFGINLADDDGFPTLSEERPNRSPHNGHLTLLARAGVPGAALWVLLQGGFGAALTRAYFRARRQRRERDALVALWILVYWAAFMMNGAFDVFLEGPYGGISFWCLFGLGIAVLQDQRSPQRASVELHRAYVDDTFTRSRLSVSRIGGVLG